MACQIDWNGTVWWIVANDWKNEKLCQCPIGSKAGLMDYYTSQHLRWLGLFQFQSQFRSNQVSSQWLKKAHPNTFTAILHNTFHSSTDSGQNPPEFKRKTTLHKTDQSYTKEITIKGISSCVQSYHIRKNSTNDVNDDEWCDAMSLPVTWHLV